MSARIVLVRHARSAHVERRWIDYDGFLRWRESYEAAGIHENEVAPDALRELAREGVVVASDAARAVGTARLLSDDVEISPLLREMELPPPRMRGIRLPLVVWMIVFGINAVMHGHATQEELARAEEAATWLETLALRNGTVLAVTHGAFRVLVLRALEARGWTGDGAKRTSAHWSAWVTVRQVS